MRLPRWLFIVFASVSIVYLAQQFWSTETDPTIYNAPKELKREKQVLVVYPVAKQNGLVTWTTDTTGGKEAQLYLTSNSSARLAALINEQKPLRVSGHFYEEKAVPEAYLNQDTRPEALNVFLVVEAGPVDQP